MGRRYFMEHIIKVKEFWWHRKFFEPSHDSGFLNTSASQVLPKRMLEKIPFLLVKIREKVKWRPKFLDTAETAHKLKHTNEIFVSLVPLL